jgi:hypothetical protein
VGIRRGHRALGRGSAFGSHDIGRQKRGRSGGVVPWCSLGRSRLVLRHHVHWNSGFVRPKRPLVRIPGDVGKPPLLFSTEKTNDTGNPLAHCSCRHPLPRLHCFTHPVQSPRLPAAPPVPPALHCTPEPVFANSPCNSRLFPSPEALGRCCAHSQTGRPTEQPGCFSPVCRAARRGPHAPPNPKPSPAPCNTAKLSPILLNRTSRLSFAGDPRPHRLNVSSGTMPFDAKEARRRRSSSLVYTEPPESLEQLSDQSALPNLNAEWVHAKGASRAGEGPLGCR